jgi:hypothetical protein
MSYVVVGLQGEAEGRRRRRRKSIWVALRHGMYHGGTGEWQQGVGWGEMLCMVDGYNTGCHAASQSAVQGHGQWIECVEKVAYAWKACVMAFQLSAHQPSSSK